VEQRPAVELFAGMSRFFLFNELIKFGFHARVFSAGVFAFLLHLPFVTPVMVGQFSGKMMTGGSPKR